MTAAPPIGSSLVFESLSPFGLTITDRVGHHCVFQDPGLRVEAFDSGGAMITSGLYDYFRVAVDDLPLFDVRQLSSYQTDRHSFPKEPHSRRFNAHVKRSIPPSGRRAEGASSSGNQHRRQAGDYRRPKFHKVR